MKRILVASSTSQNKLKSTCEYIKNHFTAKGIDVEVIGESIYEANINEIKPDLIVAIGPRDFGGSIPTVSGLAFITGMNMNACCEEIASLLEV
jgi:galactitol-specific phosphotransferase system IIB component